MQNEECRIMRLLRGSPLRRTWLAGKTAWQAVTDSSSLELATTVAAATENQMPCMKPNPFCFLLSALCLVTATAATADWSRVTLASPGGVELAGPVGAALKRGVERLNQPPYTTDWLLADVSFKLNRAFTNYSGDVSGRFLELAALTSLLGRYSRSE